MGLLVERTAAIGREYRRARPGLSVETPGLCRHVEVALGAKKEAVPGAASPAHQADTSVKCGLGRAGGETEVATAALGVESGGDGDRLDQRGLAASVLADEEGDLRMEFQLAEEAS